MKQIYFSLPPGTVLDRVEIIGNGATFGVVAPTAVTIDGSTVASAGAAIDAKIRALNPPGYLSVDVHYQANGRYLLTIAVDDTHGVRIAATPDAQAIDQPDSTPSAPPPAVGPPAPGASTTQNPVWYKDYRALISLSVAALTFSSAGSVKKPIPKKGTTK